LHVVRFYFQIPDISTWFCMLQTAKVADADYNK